MKIVDFLVIFDNGGGVTLQMDDGFLHHYDFPGQAADDVSDLLDGGTTSGWEGNESEEECAIPESEFGYLVYRGRGR